MLVYLHLKISIQLRFRVLSESTFLDKALRILLFHVFDRFVFLFLFFYHVLPCGEDVAGGKFSVKRWRTCFS